MQEEEPYLDFENCFAEPVTFSDVQAVFETLDQAQDKRITKKKFVKLFPELGVSGDANDIFKALDAKNTRGVTMDDFQELIRDPPEEIIDFLAKLLSGFVYDTKYPPPNGEMDMDKIKALLADKSSKSEWQERIKAMQSFTRQVCKMRDNKKFDTRIRKFALGFTVQLKDRRTSVFRAACASLAKIAIAKEGAFIKVAPRLIQALFDTGIRGKVQIAADSAAQCCLAIVKHCPDNNKGLILDTLGKNVKEKGYDFSRIAAYALLSLVLANVIFTKKKHNDGWWKKVAGLVKLGIKDASAIVRRNAHGCLVQIEAANSSYAETVISKLKKTEMKTFKEMKGIIDVIDPNLQLTRTISLAKHSKKEQTPDLNPNPILPTPKVPRAKTVEKKPKSSRPMERVHSEPRQRKSPALDPAPNMKSLPFLNHNNIRVSMPVGLSINGTSSAPNISGNIPGYNYSHRFSAPTSPNASYYNLPSPTRSPTFKPLMRRQSSNLGVRSNEEAKKVIDDSKRRSYMWDEDQVLDHHKNGKHEKRNSLMHLLHDVGGHDSMLIDLDGLESDNEENSDDFLRSEGFSDNLVEDHEIDNLDNVPDRGGDFLDSEENSILNAFGNPITETDVQYLFEFMEHGGRITEKRFLAAVKNFGIQLGDKNLKNLFKQIDLDGDKALNYSDFQKSIKRRRHSQRALWESLFSMSHLEQPPADGYTDVFELKTMLTTSTDYHLKVAALHNLGKLMLQKQSLNDFYSLFSSVRNEIILSLKERIHPVVRETCVVLAKLVQVRNNELYEWVVDLMKELFEIARNSSDVISASAHQCLCLFVRCMDDPDCRMINLLQEAMKHKNDKIKFRAMQYVCLIVQKIRFDGTDDVRPQMWNNIFACVRMGVHVINNDVRTEALKCLAQSEMANYIQAQEIINRLNKTARNRYNDILASAKKQDKALEQEYYRTRPKHAKKSSGIQFASANIDARSVSMDTTPSLPVHSAFDTTPFSGRSIHIPTKSNISFDTTPSPSNGITRGEKSPISPLSSTHTRSRPSTSNALDPNARGDKSSPISPISPRSNASPSSPFSPLSTSNAEGSSQNAEDFQNLPDKSVDVSSIPNLPPIKPLGDLAGFLEADDKKADAGDGSGGSDIEDDQMEDISQLCDMYDDGKKGYLTQNEFKQVLEFFCMPQEEVDIALQEVDPTQTSQISFQEIETWFMDNRMHNQESENWTQILHGEDESSMGNTAWRDEFSKQDASKDAFFIPELNEKDLAQKAQDYGYDLLNPTQLRIRVRLVQAMLKLEEEHRTYQVHEQRLKLCVLFYLLKQSEDDTGADEDDDVQHAYKTRLEALFEQYDPPLVSRVHDILRNNLHEEHAVYLAVCKHYQVSDVLSEYQRRLPVNKDDMSPEVEELMKKHKFDPVQGGGWRSDIYQSEDEVISLNSSHPHRCGSGKVQYFLLFDKHFQCWHKPTGVQFLTFIKGNGTLLVHNLTENGELFTTRISENDQPHIILSPNIWTAMEMENGKGHVLSYLTKFPHALTNYNEKKFPRSINDLITQYPNHADVLRRLDES